MCLHRAFRNAHGLCDLGDAAHLDYGQQDAQLGRSFALIKLGRLDEAEESIRRAEELRASPRAIRLQRKLIAKLRAGSPQQ